MKSKVTEYFAYEQRDQSLTIASSRTFWLQKFQQKIKKVSFIKYTRSTSRILVAALMESVKSVVTEPKTPDNVKNQN